MSEACNSNCGSCGVACDQRQAPSDFLEKLNEKSSVGKVIAVVSGKGGVGKSMVTSMLAVNAAKAGKKVAVLDADITGPSIPTAFGVHDRPMGDESGIQALESRGGIKVMSINLLLENETDPVVWRGPIIAGTVKQFWSDVVWGDIDYMFVDMPPGTGDVPLTVFQSIPLDGIIIVTSPQELVTMIVEKAVNMAKLMNIPVLGMVENMSYIECPDCGKKIYPFGESGFENTAKRLGVKPLMRIPMTPRLSSLCDAGKIEEVDCVDLKPIEEVLKKLKDKK